MASRLKAPCLLTGPRFSEKINCCVFLNRRNKTIFLFFLPPSSSPCADLECRTSIRTPPAPVTLRIRVEQEVMGRNLDPSRPSHWTVLIGLLPLPLLAFASTHWAVCNSITELRLLTPLLMVPDLLLQKITGTVTIILQTSSLISEILSIYLNALLQLFC